MRRIRSNRAARYRLATRGLWHAGPHTQSRRAGSRRGHRALTATVDTLQYLPAPYWLTQPSPATSCQSPNARYSVPQAPFGAAASPKL